MSKKPHKMNDIVDLDKNIITLDDIEFISKNDMSKNDYLIKFNRNLYSNIFLRLTHKYFSEHDAQMFWYKILKHRNNLIDKLKRDPGLVVTCLDYLTNVEHILSEATIIEEGRSEYIITTNLVDKLTKLFIRGVFDVIILKEFDYSRRANIPLSLLMVDIDNFKSVNDKYGHQKGDEVLTVIGSIILNSIRSIDIACRYGGEELTIIMPNTTEQYAKLIAERIREKIEQGNFEQIRVTVSIGASTLTNESISATDFIKKVDNALYKAKRNGKNQVVFY